MVQCKTITQPANVFLATGGIALYLQAVQQYGCKIIHREWK